MHMNTPDYVYPIFLPHHRQEFNLSFDAKTKGHDTLHTYAAKHSSTWNRDGHIQCSWAMESSELCLGAAGTVITSLKYARKIINS